MIEEMIKIAAMISEMFFTKIHKESMNKNPNYGGYYRTIDIITEMTKVFYKKYEKEINSDQETWIHVYQNEGVHDYRDLIFHWIKKHLAEHYNLHVS